MGATSCIYAQEQSWNSRFILAVDPTYSDEKQKDTLNLLLKIAKSEEINEALPLYYNALAAYYYQVEKPESMLTYLYRAIEINLANNNKTLLSTNHNLLSIYHQEQQNYEKALEAINQAIDYIDTTEQPVLLKVYESNRAGIYFMMGEYENARKIYEKNMDFYLSIEDTASFISELYNLAFCYYMLKDFDKAKNIANRILDVVEKFSDYEEVKPVQAETYGILEKIHFDQGNFKTSLQFLTKKLEIATQLNQFAMLSETCIRLSATHEKVGHLDSALKYSRLASYYKDSLFTETRLKALTEMESKYETRIKTLELEDAKNKISIEQRRKKLYIVLNMLIATLLVGGAVVLYQKIKLNKKERMLYNEHINKMVKHHELETANALLRGQDMEREHIATELHDRMGSHIGHLKLQLQMLAKKLAFDEHLSTEIKSITGSVNEAANEIRRISHNLSSGLVSKYGLKAAIDEFSARLSKSGLITMEVEYHPLQFPSFGRELETHLYRIVQEFTTNTLKHAKATRIYVDFSVIDNEIHLLFEDNGRGFDLQKRKKGIGIYNIESRVQSLNGQILFDSQIGRGTAISVRIPIQKIPIS